MNFLVFWCIQVMLYCTVVVKCATALCKKKNIYIYIHTVIKIYLLLGSSLVVRWLRLCAPNAEAEVWSLVSTLRSHMLHSAALKNKQTNKPLTAQKMLTIICAFSES